jgi:hypothetical protein
MTTLTFMINIMRRLFFGMMEELPYESMPYCLFFSLWHAVHDVDDPIILH